MKQFMKRLVFLFFVLSYSLSLFSQDFDVVKKGQKVPEFTVRMMNGKALDIADYQGSVVLINFFATWCGPCRKEMPLLQNEVWEKFKDSRQFKMISLGRGHNNDEVAAFKESQELGFPMFGDKDKSIYNKFATGYIPRNYIINSDGKIVYASVGFNEEEFEKMIKLLEHLVKQ